MAPSDLPVPPAPTRADSPRGRCTVIGTPSLEADSPRVHPPALRARAATLIVYSADRVGPAVRDRDGRSAIGHSGTARELGRYIETMSDCRNERADSGSPAATRPQPRRPSPAQPW